MGRHGRIFLTFENHGDPMHALVLAGSPVAAGEKSLQGFEPPSSRRFIGR